METYTFDCGCSLPVVGPPPRGGALPLFSFDVNRPPMDCPAVWAMLARGDVKGVFQLETGLGRAWAKKVRPAHKFDMGALGALLRPGPLNARDDEGVSMADHYARRKNGEEPVEPVHPAVDPVLKNSFNVMIFQEQAMRLAAEIAGFSPAAVQSLRKAIGKKDEALLAKVGEEFLAGCGRAGVVPTEVAERVWGWMKACGRYLFNRAHADAYGVRGYKTAWAKAHAPVYFFAAWLKTAREKSNGDDDVRELVNEARLFNVPIFPPDVRDLQPHTWTDGVDVHFGLADIKGVGERAVLSMREKVKGEEARAGKPFREWGWFELLARHGAFVTRAAFEAMIKAGAVRSGLARRYMLEELLLYDLLTDREKEWALASGRTTLLDALEAGAALSNPYTEDDARAGLEGVDRKALNAWLKGRFGKTFSSAGFEQLLEARAAFGLPAPAQKKRGACHDEGRVKVWEGLIAKLKSPATSLADTPSAVARDELALLGAPLTFTGADSIDPDRVNCSCRDFKNGLAPRGAITLGVEVQSLVEKEIKRGKSAGRKMAGMVLADGTAAVNDVVCWSDEWERLSPVLYEGATVVVSGKRGKGGEFVVNDAWPA